VLKLGGLESRLEVPGKLLKVILEKGGDQLDRSGEN